MKKFTLKYLDESKKAASEPYEIHCENYKEAVITFCREKPSDFPYVQYASFVGGRHRVDNPYSQTRQLSEKKEKKKIKRFSNLEFIDKIITIIESSNGAPLQLTFDQLEFLIENFNLFPTLEKSLKESYFLQEKLYMLSLLDPNLQTAIQTRILSDKLDALQMAITGVASTQVGIANDQAKRHNTSTLGQAATLATLGRIAQDTDEVGEFFGD